MEWKPLWRLPSCQLEEEKEFSEKEGEAPFELADVSQDTGQCWGLMGQCLSAQSACDPRQGHRQRNKLATIHLSPPHS